MAIITKYTCDRCGANIQHPKRLRISEASMKRDLCASCVDGLRLWLRGTHTTERVTVFEVSEKELQEVYRKGAEALEAWALGATADEMAQHVRDMMTRARREEIEEKPKTLLGIAI